MLAAAHDGQHIDIGAYEYGGGGTVTCPAGE